MPDKNPNRPAFWKQTLRPGGKCPGIAALTAAEPAPEVQRHLAECSRCRTELAMLREFESAAPRAEEAASVQWIQSELLRRAPELAERPRAIRPLPVGQRLTRWMRDLLSPRHRVAFGVAAACLLLLVSVGIYSRRGGDAPLVNPANPEVWRSGQFAAVAPIGDIGATPAKFQWEAVPGAANYIVHLSEVDGAEIWSAESGGTSITPPPEVRDLLIPGRAFHWRVVAKNAAGETVASTDSQIFHILATRQ